MVAIIDLTADSDSKGLHDAVYKALLDHWALSPMRTEAFNAALQGDFLDEDSAPLGDAAKRRAEADDKLARFDFQAARAAASEGLDTLVVATPSAATAAAADLAFLAGVAELELRHGKDAAAFFAYAHRLSPAYAVDPIRYLPEIVQAYKQAASAPVETVKLSIQGFGHAWIDGLDRGAAPGTFDVAAGWHLVQLAGPELETAGKVVAIDRAQTLPIGAASASDERRVQRARRALAQLPDDAVARAGAMNQLADLLKVHDAVLIWKRKEDGKLLVQTWRDRAPGFSTLREHDKEPASELLAPLAPPAPPEPPPVVVPPPPPPAAHEDEPAWYRRRWVQATVAGGVVVGIVGAILYARRTMSVEFPGTGQWPSP
ncbi:MAG TPA: hypothetical protein VMJ10_11605 [Kofleriaceae bacterium]|nr:hypothetical protein [Kofleriaceae bacterium]